MECVYNIQYWIIPSLSKPQQECNLQTSLLSEIQFYVMQGLLESKISQKKCRNGIKETKICRKEKMSEKIRQSKMEVKSVKGENSAWNYP